jgi:hypothetical protein
MRKIYLMILSHIPGTFLEIELDEDVYGGYISGR